jgi:hypothetical protein
MLAKHHEFGFFPATKIFAILVGALNTAVPVRGQDNVEPDCREKRSTAFAAKQQGRRCCDSGPYERQDSVFQLWVCQSRHERTSNRRFDRGITAIN